MQRQKKRVPIREFRPRRAFPRINGRGGSSRPHSGRERSTITFAAGESVRETGIYEVVHDHEHRTAHEVVMLSGDSFPPCDTCEQRVRFRLVRTAPYIFQDEDFEEQS
ncbi:MAG: hypothetical protein ACRD4F_18225 [Candidatus Angelobacter sp.]